MGEMFEAMFFSWLPTKSNPGDLVDESPELRDVVNVFSLGEMGVPGSTGEVMEPAGLDGDKGVSFPVRELADFFLPVERPSLLPDLLRIISTSEGSIEVGIRGGLTATGILMKEATGLVGVGGNELRMAA